MLRLHETDLDPEEGYSTLLERDRAFLEWTTRSPDHLRIFLETFAVHWRLRDLDRSRLIQIQDLLGARPGDVVPLFKGAEPSVAAGPIARARAWLPRWPRNRLMLGAAAAAAVLISVGVTLYLEFFSGSRCMTNVGEQRECKLEDGSFAILNTDSQIDTDFSSRARGIRLVRGEAFFIVQHDSHRPFVVQTATATVRVLGTQFNIRRREGSTDIAVIDGSVQVAATELPAGVSTQLGAGEQVRVEHGRLAVGKSPPAAEVLAWRQRRLIFFDAKLGDVAAEFNRYNRIHVEIDDPQARDKHISGIFDADRPQSLVIWAAQDDTLVVLPQGDHWAIRSR